MRQPTFDFDLLILEDKMRRESEERAMAAAMVSGIHPGWYRM
jgi:hypothetical protein